MTTINSLSQSSENLCHSTEQLLGIDVETMTDLLLEELRTEIKTTSLHVQAIANRIALEVQRICSKSPRIQTSGEVRSWQLNLGRHRLQKCLSYYRLGSKRGRVELHSNLSAMVYRYVVSPNSQLGFQARYNLIEDFLQEFYAESIKAFRRENELTIDYTPRTQLELAEYMAFSEQYAKRRINLPNGTSQQLIVLRAQGFARRQPAETSMDIEKAIEFPRGEDADTQSRSAAMHQLRSQLVADTIDPAEAVLRDRVVAELMEYLQAQGQEDCVNYLVLKLQDLSAPEIDEILGLTARQRDYLQQRFKYHVEKFSRQNNWKLVHQWLGADLDQKLGLSSQQWEAFWNQLSLEQQQLLQLKQAQVSEREIAQTLGCTPKQLQKRWTQVLEMAWKIRNQGDL
ncbi:MULTISPECIES: HetZ-related protein [unclassified Coleofasciculus]|uniref:HetZ-related protein n=1 Tax=Cyanophyceae TaxID=3028117 RepID=UPI0016853D37|nr:MULTISPECIES: HetZ-related protein [unclassified Coleofasciculus]MBD1878039.1 HetZ-related protein [Coleofasciculus sp. FACHB-T130]MBD1893426.1 HetZ-related protein [Coleofasciculus sp. FACHB-129]